MLISKLSSCFRYNLYSFSQVKLYKAHVQKYFDNDYALINKEVKQLSKKYSLDQKGIQKLFKTKPEVFLPSSQQRRQIQDKITFLNELEQTQPIAKVINEVLFDSQHLLSNMSKDNILQFIKFLRQNGFDQKSASKIFLCSANLIHNNFDLLYKQKVNLLTDYLQITPAKALQIFVNQPFLLKCSNKHVRETIIYFLSRQNQIFTRQKIIELLSNLGQIFLIGRQQLNQLIQWYLSWGIQKKQLWNILLENPLLFLNHPAQVFHFKAKMFRQFRFTQSMGQNMLRKYPSILICSVRSLQSKFLTARDRLKIKLNDDNLQFLRFKYMANIRPRSQLMIRAKIPFTSEDIVDYFDCSQRQFLLKTKIPQQKYTEELNKYRITPQLDFSKRKCMRGYPTDKKIFEYSIKYYAKEDLILKEK